MPEPVCRHFQVDHCHIVFRVELLQDNCEIPVRDVGGYPWYFESPEHKPAQFFLPNLRYGRGSTANDACVTLACVQAMSCVCQVNRHADVRQPVGRSRRFRWFYWWTWSEPRVVLMDMERCSNDSGGHEYGMRCGNRYLHAFWTYNWKTICCETLFEMNADIHDIRLVRHRVIDTWRLAFFV